MPTLDELLELQGHDTVIDQLQHRLATLEERAVVERIEKEIAAHATSVAALEAERQLLVREQSRLEDSVFSVEEKREREEAKLYDGSVSAIKELQALQDEIASLKRRQSVLEDDLIEILEAVEPLDAQLEQMSTVGAQQEQARDDALAALAVAEADIRAELQAEEDRRTSAATGIPADLLAEYEKLRSRFKGVAVARISNGSCMGCHLALSAVEVDRIRREPPDAIIHCDECGRLLVR